MYIITYEGVIKSLSNTIEYGPLGYPITDSGEAFTVPMHEVHEVESVPDGVEPNAWCYGEAEGFHRYVPPNRWGLPESTVGEIKDEAVTEVQKEVKNNADTKTTGTDSPA